VREAHQTIIFISFFIVCSAPRVVIHNSNSDSASNGLADLRLLVLGGRPQLCLTRWPSAQAELSSKRVKKGFGVVNWHTVMIPSIHSAILVTALSGYHLFSSGNCGLRYGAENVSRERSQVPSWLPWRLG
jgi:hypothetical protein